MEVLKSANVKRRKNKIISGNKQPREKLTSEGSSEEEKILNTAMDKNKFKAISEIFERTLTGLIVDNDEEVYETLCQLQHSIQAKLLTFKCANKSRCDSVNDVMYTGDLSSSRSLALSTLSLCSEKSASKVIFTKNNNAYKEFLKELNCPFCSKTEQDKISLIKHLDENCQPLINNKFEEINFIPFSAFQILPNNTIKCNVCRNSVLKNLKHFFEHYKSRFHKIEFAKAEKMKKYTQCLFCSCCKILVPNNYTQLNFHMNHKIHKSRSEEAPHSEFYKNVDCVYLKSKKFKCLICPSRPFFSCIKDMTVHFGNENHKKKLLNGFFPKIFCEICMEEQNSEVLSHFNSPDHIEKQKLMALSEWFETCYYCGFVCSNLKELSVHMTTQCKEITTIRVKNLKQGKSCKSEVKNESKEQVNENFVLKSNNKPAKGTITGGENTKEDLHIVVKDNTDLLGVYKYFRKFGEIKRVEIYKEKNVLIHFQDEGAVKDVLLLQDVIHINGVKIEITTDEALTEAGNTVKNSQKEIYSDEQSFESSDESQSDDGESTNELAQQIPNSKLEELFQRVSHHLSNTAKTFDSSVEEKILEDLAEICPNGAEGYSVVGFAGTGLSFPHETMDVYCDVWEEHSAMNPHNFNEKLIQKFYLKLLSTSKWLVGDYFLDSNFPYIKCAHLATKKSCRFIFTPSVKYITDLLSYCIGKIDFAKKFCVVVRFWLAVHKLKVGQLDFFIISLMVFFLMRTYVSVEKVFEVCNVPNSVLLFSAIFTEYRGSIKSKGQASKLSGKESNVLKTFQQFLSFLCKFNFTRNMMVIPLAFEVPRKITDNEAFDFFFKSFDLEELRDSEICILDPHCSVNLARDINRDDLVSLLEAARITLKSTG